jgi:hypothetical protein
MEQKPYTKIDPAESLEEPYYSQSIDNFFHGDRSWWKKSKLTHSIGECRGALWVRKVDIENHQASCDRVYICEVCKTFGSVEKEHE